MCPATTLCCRYTLQTNKIRPDTKDSDALCMGFRTYGEIS
ncbi:hypothetical protein HMPREF9446_03053 [Bacteroides fluxus YIT 12057]|uniref:Uncharacterized protein n=1 Tax=Bacteroides fluxus YIT 12057 TaxID=763034 RepID=F3PWB8_9BACE|nr:hypothetical protein HMPREF9446_03053 [Bacteroides fluxus YIT 12057]